MPIVVPDEYIEKEEKDIPLLVVGAGRKMVGMILPRLSVK